MHNVTLSLCALALLAACGDSSADSDGPAVTTVVTTVVTAPPTSTTGDASTSPTTSSTGGDATDTDSDGPSSTSTSDPTTGPDGTTTAPLPGCVNEGMECGEPPTAGTFCEHVAATCAAHGVEAFYCNIIGEKCSGRRDPDECAVCFDLQNYCAQLGSDCDGLFESCLCAHEALEGGE